MTPDELRKLTELTRFLAELRRLQETLKQVNQIQRLRDILRWLYENRARLEGLGPDSRREIRESLDAGEEWKKEKEKKTFPFYNQVLQTPFKSWKEYMIHEFGLPSERAEYDAEAWDRILRRLLDE